MGRKSKPPITVQFETPNTGEHHTDPGELPAFQEFIDLKNSRGGLEEQVIRIYFKTPEPLAVQLAKSNGVSLVIGGNTGKNGIVSVGITDDAASILNVRFGQELARLFMHRYSGTCQSYSGISNVIVSIKTWIKHFAELRKTKLISSIYDLKFDDWLAYRDYLERSNSKNAKRCFFDVVKIFCSHESTNFNGSLKRITAPRVINHFIANNGDNETSFEVGKIYSDSVMYQLLAHFVYRFKRQIEFIKYYESLSMESLGADFLPPPNKNKREHGAITEFFSRNLTTEDGFKVILNNKLLWFKLGLGGAAFVRRAYQVINKIKSLKAKYKEYLLWEGKYHMFSGVGQCTGKSNIYGLYVKRSIKSDITGSLSYAGYCLANIVMIYTGLNKEVVLSWPSVNGGKSILERCDTLFVADGKNGNEIEICGLKAKTGTLTSDKQIRVSIVIDSPLYRMLSDYFFYIKTDFRGPFFEIVKETRNSWRIRGLPEHPIVNDDGVIISSVETKKFRKVFATTKMLEHMRGIDSAQDLADKLRMDMDHNKLDVTLSNYIMKSNGANAVLDLAIATITSSKIKEAIEFQGEVVLGSGDLANKSVYLCQCSDPSNPTHGYSIAEECTYYDLCLGCKRSIICSKHLPYICLRIMQYEEQRQIMGIEWSAIFEERWLIAHDALDKYIKCDQVYGVGLVAQAWETARAGSVSLPPIIGVAF